MASKRASTLYIGVTSNLLGRLHQHRCGLIEGFTSRYGVHRLVWFEVHDDMVSAIAREKRLKKWNRDWKLNLIEAANRRGRIWRSGWGRAPFRLREWIPAFAGMTVI